MDSRRTLLALLLVAGGLAVKGQATDAATSCIGTTAAFQTLRPGTAMAILPVSADFPVGGIAITRLSAAPGSGRVGALKITLSAGASQASSADASDPAITTVVVKDIKQGGGARSLLAASFQDGGHPGVVPMSSNFPPTILSLTGIFAPSQPFTPFYANTTTAGLVAGKGGSKGTWVLRIADLGVSPKGAEASVSVLSGWTLVLCPVGVAMPTPVTPDVTSSAGPPDDSVSVATVPDTSGAGLTSNGSAVLAVLPINLTDTNTTDSMNGTATNGTVTALVAIVDGTNATLVDRLMERVMSAVSPFPGVSSVVNFTASAASDFADQQRQTAARVGAALDSLLAPYNATLVVRAIDGVTGVLSDGVTGSTLTGSPSLFSIRLLGNSSTPASSASSSNSSASAINGTNIFRSGSTNGTSSRNPERLVTRFLNSMRDLVNTASGGALASASAAPGGVASMAQSGLGLGSSDSSALGSLLSGATSGPIVSQILGAPRVRATLEAVQNTAASLKTRPGVLAGQKALQQSASGYRDSVNSAAQVLGLGTQFAQKAVQDKIAFLNNKSNLVSDAVTQQITNYDTAIQAASALITSQLRDRGQKMVQAAEALSAAAAAAAANLGKMPPGTARNALLSQVTTLGAQAGALRGKGLGLRDGASQVATSLFGAYKAHLQAAKNIINAKSSSAMNLAQVTTSGYMNTLTAILNRVTSALTARAQNAGPLAGKSLDMYKAGLQFLGNAVGSLKSSLTGGTTSGGFLSGSGLQSLLANKGTLLQGLTSGSGSSLVGLLQAASAFKGAAGSAGSG